MRSETRRSIVISLAVGAACVCAALLVLSGLRGDPRLSHVAFAMAGVLLLCVPVVWLLRRSARASTRALQIHGAIDRADVARLRELLARDAELVHAADERGGTPLHRCALEGQAGMAELLLTAGADVNARERLFDFTPLHLAACWGYGPIVAAVHPEMDRLDFGQRSAQAGEGRMVQVLLDHDADVNARDGLGRTPLHMAALAGHAGTATQLLQQGARVNVRDAMQLTPLHYAAFGDHRAVAELILAAGGDPNATTGEGCAPLHTAAEKGARGVAKALLDHGADMEACTAHGHTPLALTLLYGHEDLAELLRASGARQVT